MAKNKKAQEEMVGFVVIVIMVSVGLLILLGFLINQNPNKNAVESYQVESFIQSALQYTTSCENGLGFLEVQDLVIACNQKETCLDGTNSCDLLNNTLRGLIESGWDVSSQSATKGYKLGVLVNEQENLVIKEGNETTQYKGAFQDFSRSGEDYEVSLNVYY